MDLERMIDGFVRSGLGAGRSRQRRRRSAFGLGGQGLLAKGLLAIAIAAYDHFRSRSGGVAGPGGMAGPGGYAPSGGPPPPPPPAPASPPSPPPPPAPSAPAPSAPAPSAGPAPGDALVVLRAMIAAAYADGALDPEERARILDRMTEAGFGPEEREFLERELAAPRPIESLTAGVRSPALAAQIYAASLVALDVDDDRERDYLAALARQLGLSPDLVQGLHAELDPQPQPHAGDA